ncbi:MAG: hypothetical protein KDJ27_13440 [Gammaproteobacteria bacterium]|nr:hypothetical protein [Gammaproteobacteria bacterium]
MSNEMNTYSVLLKIQEALDALSGLYVMSTLAGELVSMKGDSDVPSDVAERLSSDFFMSGMMEVMRQAGCCATAKLEAAYNELREIGASDER